LLSPLSPPPPPPPLTRGGGGNSNSSSTISGIGFTSSSANNIAPPFAKSAIEDATMLRLANLLLALGLVIGPSAVAIILLEAAGVV
jgi:hypothetical protein